MINWYSSTPESLKRELSIVTYFGTFKGKQKQMMQKQMMSYTIHYTLELLSEQMMSEQTMTSD
jgi:hypothetical protein